MQQKFMLALLSPSKDLNYKTDLPGFVQSTNVPRLWSKSWEIVEVLKKKKASDLQKLMDISPKLAAENISRNQSFTKTFTSENSRPAIFAFAGDVYRGLDAWTLDQKQLEYCEKHVRILSGLYGLLRPMDLMQAYRLEMGTTLAVQKKKNLVAYWKETVTDLLIQDIENSQSKFIINTASQEYFDVLNLSSIHTPIINIHFREYKNNTLRFVSYTAKRARGLLVRYMANERISKPDKLKLFNLEQYQFSEELSNEFNYFFIR